MNINELSRHPTGAAEIARAAPVIVMAYAGSGADRLRPALSAFPELICTSGTGILPLCHHAVTAWQAVDSHPGGGFSPLGQASVRTLSAGLVTAILARNRGTRWCEFSTAPPAAAETFMRLYPQTRFLIVHRRADAVVRAIVDASRWGLAGSEFVPFVSANPASSVAALASYWVTHTAQQLDFQEAHRQSCLRVRIEDLTTDATQTRVTIGDFLALDGGDISPWLTQGDLDGQARAHRNLGRAHIMLGETALARSHLTQAIELSRLLGDQVGEARAHINLSAVCGHERRADESLASSLRALDLAEAAGHPVLQAMACNNAGYDYAVLGDFHRAAAYCQRGLDLHGDLDSPSLKASTCDSFGYIHHQLGDYGQAIRCYLRAVTLFHRVGARYLGAKTLSNLGDSYHAIGDTESARASWQQALAILRALNHPDAAHPQCRLQSLAKPVSSAGEAIVAG